jgi:hypothetical protein
MKLTDLKLAVNSLLKSKYKEPDYKIYGKEIKEGYQTPSFFAEIVDGGDKAETKNFSSGRKTIKITYFQKETNELDQLQKVDEIKDLFGLVFLVGNRKITVGEFSHDYIGEYSDILQISIEFDYKENTSMKETQEVADTLNMNMKNS